MSIRRRRIGNVIDSVGVLAVVLGLVLGLLPGITSAASAALTGEYIPCNTHPNFKIERAILDLSDGTESITLDTADGYLECDTDGGNQARIKFVTHRGLPLSRIVAL